MHTHTQMQAVYFHWNKAAVSLSSSRLHLDGAEAVNSSNCKSVSIKLRGRLSPKRRAFNKSSSKAGAFLALGGELKSQTAIKPPNFAHYTLFIGTHKRSQYNRFAFTGQWS